MISFLNHLALPMLLMMGCGGNKKDVVPRVTGKDVDVAQAAWARSVPFALQGSYSVTIDAPRMGISGSTRGGLLVHRPGRFRMEIVSPVGTPLLYAASNGQAVSLYVVNERLWLGAERGEDVLRELTSGAAGIEDLISVMTGRLPFEDAEILLRKTVGQNEVFTFAGPQNTRAIVVLDSRMLTTRRIEAYDQDGRLVLEADYDEYMKVGRSQLPEEVRVHIPLVDMRVELDFSGWDELGVIPDAFDVPPTNALREIDLVDMLERAKAAKRDGYSPADLDALMAYPVEPAPEPAPVVPEPVPERAPVLEPTEGSPAQPTEDTGAEQPATPDGEPGAQPPAAETPELRGF